MNSSQAKSPQRNRELDKTGIEAAAAWSLYPLADDGSPHMGPIYAAIDEAKASGITVTSEHFATILRGDLADVLTVIVNAWPKSAKKSHAWCRTYRFQLDSPSAQPAGDTA